MKRLILVFTIIVSYLHVIAQQDPTINHIFFNKVYINPAFAGLDDLINANFIRRQQWMGFQGAPLTNTLTLNAPVRFLGIKSGVGLQITDDRLGFEKNFNGSLQYNYIHDLRSGRLSFGLQLGVFNKAYDAKWIAVDGVLNDNSIPLEKDHNMKFDMAIGAVYAYENFYVGLSADHLTQSKFSFSNIELPYLKRHYYLISGYKISIPNSSFEFMPNLLIKYDGASPQFALNINALYNKKFWGGVTYRTINETELNFGLELFNGIKIGLSYGMDFSKMIKTNSGSFEIMIGYSFNFVVNKIPQKYKSVRFL